MKREIRDHNEYEKQERPYEQEPLRTSAIAPTHTARLDPTQVAWARAREEPVSMSMYSSVFTPSRAPMPYDLFLWLYS